MNSRTWILRTVLAIALILCANFATACLLDPYGLFQNPRGRQLRVVFAPRKAKFLLSRRYVPTNYDGLLIGPSSSENWDPASISGVKIYNESVLGSNISEEKRIVDQATPTGHFKLAICILYPTMTTNHRMNDGLDSVTSLEALGSIHLLVHEAEQVLSALHIPFGRQSAPNGATPLRQVSPNANIGRPAPNALQLGPDYFQIDPVAILDYRQLLQDLSSRGVRILYVIPPLYQPCQTANLQQLVSYKESIRKLLPQAPVIDLDAPDFSSFRSDPSNYLDCFHLSAVGASRVDSYLAQKVPAVLAEHVQ